MDLQSGYPFWPIRDHDGTGRHCHYQAWIFTIDGA